MNKHRLFWFVFASMPAHLFREEGEEWESCCGGVAFTKKDPPKGAVIIDDRFDDPEDVTKCAPPNTCPQCLVVFERAAQLVYQ